MKRITLLTIYLILITSLQISAEWKKVFGGSVNNIIVYNLIEHQGYFFATRNSSLLRSSDKGETWGTINLGLGTMGLESDGSRIFVGKFSGTSTLVYSDDNGETWIDSDLSQAQISEIRVINPNLMFAYSNFQKFYKSTDRGATWTEMIGLPFSATYRIYVTNTGRILISGYYSDDNGQTWTETEGGLINSYSENEDGIWAGAGKLFLSHDNGETWEEKLFGYTTSVIASGNNIFRGVYGFTYSTDGGETFVSYDEGIEEVDQIISMLFDGEFILIGLDGPGIYKIAVSELGITTSVEQTEELAYNYELSQNYPNPFNPSTTIRFSIPESGFVTLKIYDMLGKEVASLVNEELPTGTYNAVFDASSSSKNLSSGVYLYRLKANNFVQTKKLTLIK